MDLKISFVEKAPKAALTAIGVFENGELGETGKTFDKASDGALARAIKLANFEGKTEKFMRLPSLYGNDGQIMLVGLGDTKKHNAFNFEKIGARLFACLNALREQKIVIDLSDIQDVN